MTKNNIPEFGAAFLAQNGGEVDPQSRESAMAHREPEYELMMAAKSALDSNTDNAVKLLKPVADVFISTLTTGQNRTSINLSKFDGIFDAISEGSIEMLESHRQLIELYSDRYGYGSNSNTLDMNILMEDEELDKMIAQSEGISVEELRNQRREEEVIKLKEKIDKKPAPKKSAPTQKDTAMTTPKRTAKKPATRENLTIAQPAPRKTVGQIATSKAASQKPAQPPQNRETRRSAMKSRSFVAPTLTREEMNEQMIQSSIQHIESALDSVQKAAEVLSNLDLSTQVDGVDSIFNLVENLQLLTTTHEALVEVHETLSGIDENDENYNDEDSDDEDSDDEDSDDEDSE